MKQYCVGTPEAAHILELPEGKTYEIFQELNQEPKVQGYITASEYVSRAFFNKEFFSGLEEMAGRYCGREKEFCSLY